MKLQIFALLVLTFTTVALAQGRKPAVEDFVGIEVEEPNTTPSGTENLFNFEKEITQYKTTLKAVDKPKPTSHWTEAGATNPSSLVGLAFVIGLPALSLVLVMSRFRQKAAVESASNIEVLEKYRKEREQRKSQEDDIRKAS